MDKLFIETENTGRIPIDDSIVQKYNLHKGSTSPFTGNRIVNQFGDDTVPEQPPEKRDLSNHEDEIKDLENGFQLSTSEMLDIAAGVDSTAQ